MTFQSTNSLSGFPQPFTRVFPAPVRAQRAPLTTDISYQIGQLWVDEAGDDYYGLVDVTSGSATWNVLASTPGSLSTLTGGSGGAITPVAGDIILAGTASQITTVGTAGTITFSLPAAITAPGSLTTTTTLVSGTGITSTTGDITASTGDLISTLGAVDAATTVTAGTGVTATTGDITASAGDLIATLGDITATAGAVSAGTTVDSGTTMTCGTGFTVTTGGILVSGGDIINTHSDAGTDVTIEVTNSDNTNGASRSGVEIATGGSSSGDPFLSFQISGVGASTMTMGLDNSASDLFVISNSTAIGTSNALTLSQAGALTATTSLTATLGDITATDGNLVLGTAGNKINSTSVATTTTAGANAFGTVTLVLGTATISTTAVTASSQIMLTRQSIGSTGAAALGHLTVGAIVAGSSFVISAVQAADATADQTTDVSVIGWMIIN